MQGKKNFQEKLFLQFQLCQKVPEHNFYRRLKELLDLRWLYKKTRKYWGSEGQKSIDPVVFFKLILIGYLANLGSDRRIINTVSMRMDMLYFLGYDLDEELPRHSTLSRTRQLYSEEVFKLLFRKVLSQCIDKGMVSGRRQAVDSVPVKAKANASLNSLQRKAVLKDGEDYAASLRDEAISTRDADGVAVVAYNLKKLLRFQAPKVSAAVVKMMKKAEKSLQSLVLIVSTIIAPHSIKKSAPFSPLYSPL